MLASDALSGLTDLSPQEKVSDVSNNTDVASDALRERRTLLSEKQLRSIRCENWPQDRTCRCAFMALNFHGQDDQVVVAGWCAAHDGRSSRVEPGRPGGGNEQPAEQRRIAQRS